MHRWESSDALRGRLRHRRQWRLRRRTRGLGEHGRRLWRRRASTLRWRLYVDVADDNDEEHDEEEAMGEEEDKENATEDQQDDEDEEMDDEEEAENEETFESAGGFAAACRRLRILVHAGGFARDAHCGPSLV